MDWVHTLAKPVSSKAREKAFSRQQSLTKPAGSLGQLEALAIQLASLQDCDEPKIENPAICIFAADHGVAAEGVSAFPQEVTKQMLLNFANGGAAISVLAHELQATIQIVNMGIASHMTEIDTILADKILDYSIAAGTNNFCRQAAMSHTELEQSLLAGKKIIDTAHCQGIDLFIGGEMGIANTTSAAALACALLKKPASALVGRGTGLDDAGLQHKITTVDAALEKHKAGLTSPQNCLLHLGGFEIAALTGAYLRCAQSGITVLVDGFICSVAALVATRINPSITPWLIYSHESAEAGHKQILHALNAQAILQLDMRLGEASGAATALPIIKLACALHNNMATFAEAGVADK